jgi:hypothetical protein
VVQKTAAIYAKYGFRHILNCMTGGFYGTADTHRARLPEASLKRMNL